MKIHPDHIGVQSIHGYGPGWVQVGAEKIFHSVIITPAGDRIDWACQHFEQLSTAHFEQLTHFPAELVIFGSGPRLRFAAPALSLALIERQIGLETMDTHAACRTYNILAAEGRQVVAALLMQ
ncbi:MAG: Mth938-like domain-containing protein [Rhodoferax sp.]|uniref:Mth938-like domain-containing protein n=1 Tax=Rhodoferax sp. TaxID=50421 RepID=UPI001B7738CF|nr:Mth938-like domain-containing protein [Rhodoferax sp.]MBP9905001.1 Mth938-like domain-containing protein [Rhodoferax sp.]